AREDLLGRIRRSQYGYHSARSIETHFLPYDPPASAPFTWELGSDASAHFEVGSNAYAPVAALGVSLPYIRQLGVERIEAHRQPLLERLRKEIPRLGFELATPPETKSSLITFIVKDRQPVFERLQKANINVRLGAHFLRVSPSVYNDMADIDRLLEALSLPNSFPFSSCSPPPSRSPRARPASNHPASRSSRLVIRSRLAIGAIMATSVNPRIVQLALKVNF